MTEGPGGWTVEAVLASRPGRLVARARRAGGTPAVLKATLPGAGWAARAALRREARLLEVVRGDGVVEVMDVVDRRGRTTLVLGFVPAGALDRRPAPDAEVLARRLEATVDHLHRSGVVHGALRCEHVVLDADGLPVLVGFGSARRSGSTAADTAALAHLLGTIRTNR